LHQESSLPVGERFGNSAGWKRYHWHSRRKRFEQHTRKAFFAGRDDQQIELPQNAADIIAPSQKLNRKSAGLAPHFVLVAPSAEE
jgi:hypothetical protein